MPDLAKCGTFTLTPGFSPTELGTGYVILRLTHSGHVNLVTVGLRDETRWSSDDEALRLLLLRGGQHGVQPLATIAVPPATRDKTASGSLEALVVSGAATSMPSCQSRSEHKSTRRGDNIERRRIR